MLIWISDNLNDYLTRLYLKIDVLHDVYCFYCLSQWIRKQSGLESLLSFQKFQMSCLFYYSKCSIYDKIGLYGSQALYATIFLYISGSFDPLHQISIRQHEKCIGASKKLFHFMEFYLKSMVENVFRCRGGENHYISDKIL